MLCIVAAKLADGPCLLRSPSSPLTARPSHLHPYLFVAGHHAYTNIPNRDPDLYHAPAFWRFSKSLRWRSAHGWQALSTPLLWTISVPTLLILKPLVAISKGSYNRAVMLMEMPPWRIALHVLGRLAVAASLYAWPWWAFPESAAKAAAFAFVPMAVYSLWFMAASQVNHHDEALSDVADPRWYRHQVRGTAVKMDGADSPSLVSACDTSHAWPHLHSSRQQHFQFGFLLPAGRHVAHHRPRQPAGLLAIRRAEPADRAPLAAVRQPVPPAGSAGKIPTPLGSALWLDCLAPSVIIDAIAFANHPSPYLRFSFIHLQPAIEAAARRHGVPYLKSATIPEAFRRLWRHLDAMGQRPAADADKAKAQ